MKKDFNPVRDIREFHEKFGLEYDGPPRALPDAFREFRINFNQEEALEYQQSSRKAAFMRTQDDFEQYTIALEDSLDALVDLTYVVLGAAYLHGFDFEEAWRRVHEANMAKVRTEREEDSKRGSSFDVVKPEGWQPPDHTDLVVRNDLTLGKD